MSEMTKPSPASPTSRLRTLRWSAASDRTVYFPVILAPYTTEKPFWRRYRRIIIVMFMVISFFYGAIFALFTTFLLVYLLVPVFIMMLICVWLLPTTEHPPVNLLGQLLLTFVAAVIVWPNYLAVALPGMPWITVIRLVAIPLAIIMMVAISVSRSFRFEMLRVINALPSVWKMLSLFMVVAFLSILVSSDPSVSVNKFIIAQLYWTLIFFAAAYTFVQPGRATSFSQIIWTCAICVCLIGIDEWRRRGLFYAGHIPSFLRIDDDALTSVLTSRGRAATGGYRVKSVFSTPLGLAEYLALATPFVIHTAVASKKLATRLGAFATIPLMFLTIIYTDSRLGVVGFFVSFLLYILAWGALRWRDRPDQMVGRLVVISYPIVLASFLLLSFTWNRLSVMMWGGGATAPSTAARRQQLADGLPMILEQPWGHGIGQAARTLGYYGAGGKLTIDSYYLTIGLEYGLIGFILYFGMFLAAIYFGGRALLKSTPGEDRLIIPVIIAVANFSIIKSIFSQESNHPLIFCMLGMIVALVHRINSPSSDSNKTAEQVKWNGRSYP